MPKSKKIKIVVFRETPFHRIGAFLKKIWNRFRKPLPAKWYDDWGMMMPHCPRCREVAYEPDHCVFCGQRYTDAHEFNKHVREPEYKYFADDHCSCGNCGGNEIELKGHADADDYYINFFSCKNCGNTMQIKYWRK